MEPVLSVHGASVTRISAMAEGQVEAVLSRDLEGAIVAVDAPEAHRS